jgi:hypothetical protein
MQIPLVFNLLVVLLPSLITMKMHWHILAIQPALPAPDKYSACKQLCSIPCTCFWATWDATIPAQPLLLPFIFCFRSILPFFPLGKTAFYWVLLNVKLLGMVSQNRHWHDGLLCQYHVLILLNSELIAYCSHMQKFLVNMYFRSCIEGDCWCWNTKSTGWDSLGRFPVYVWEQCLKQWLVLFPCSCFLSQVLSTALFFWHWGKFHWLHG